MELSLIEDGLSINIIFAAYAFIFSYFSLLVV